MDSKLTTDTNVTVTHLNQQEQQEQNKPTLPFSTTDDNVQKINSGNISTSVLKVARLSKDARLPTKFTPDAAGFDLYSAMDCIILSHEQKLIQTDLAIKVPEGTYGRIAPRSGLAFKYNIHVGAGVIDKDYCGNVGVILFNLGKEPFVIKKGDRIAQLICEKCAYPMLVEINNLTSNTSMRGQNGFGSSGI